MTLRVFAVLDARVPGIGGPARLWVVAARKSYVPRMLAARDIAYREESWGRPVDRGPVTAAMERLGLSSAPAVYAYWMPWDAGTPVLRIFRSMPPAKVAAMGDLLGHLLKS
jgi:hypothetical protein